MRRAVNIYLDPFPGISEQHHNVANKMFLKIIFGHYNIIRLKLERQCRSFVLVFSWFTIGIHYSNFVKTLCKRGIRPPQPISDEASVRLRRRRGGDSGNMQ